MMKNRKVYRWAAHKKITVGKRLYGIMVVLRDGDIRFERYSYQLKKSGDNDSYLDKSGVLLITESKTYRERERIFKVLSSNEELRAKPAVGESAEKVIDRYYNFLRYWNIPFSAKFFITFGETYSSAVTDFFGSWVEYILRDTDPAPT